MSQPPTPAENVAAILRLLGHAVVTQGITGRLAAPLVALIIDRLRGIAQRFARIAARVAAGRYVPRTVAPRRRAATPRPANPLPQSFGWLLKLVPEAVGSRSQLECLLRDPAMDALLAAAPAALARPLRSLCRMLLVPPPPILAPAPARRRRARRAKAPAAAPRPPQPHRATAPPPATGCRPPRTA